MRAASAKLKGKIKPRKKQKNVAKIRKGRFIVEALLSVK
jgi:hypothetical protein